MIFMRKISFVFIFISIIGCIIGKHIRNKRSNEDCSPDDMKFRCGSNECIDLGIVCDGKSDCSDKSDETAGICSNIRCTPDNFQCAYGACISFGKECNQINDCIDSSDEDDVLCNYTRSPVKGTCPVYFGAHLEIYHESDNNTKLTDPNDYIDPNHIIYYKCEEGFHRFGPDNNVCEMRTITWRNEIPICEKRCPKIPIDRLAYKISTDRGEPVEYGEYLRPGTKLKLECEIGYYEKYVGYHTKKEIVCNENGDWDFMDLIECEPICGEYEHHGNSYIIARPLNKVVPWNVGIYKYNSSGLWDHFCGGTIISTRIVVSAAHCFQTTNKINYTVAAGKYFRDFYFANETRAIQTFNLKELYIHPQFNTSTFEADFAILVLDKPVIYHVHISPICVDWEMDIDKENINIQGSVAGWGLHTKTISTPSAELRGANFSLANTENCKESNRNSYKEDKFCVGGTMSHAICTGDSGSGFVTHLGDNKMYILGIVSFTSKKDECHPGGYYFITNVAKYFSNLTIYVNKYKN